MFRTRTRDEWAKVFATTDACVAPVLTLTEAPTHPHNVERRTFVKHAGIVQPAPAPRFSRTTVALERTAPAPGEHTDEVLSEVGYQRSEIERLRAAGAVA